MPKILSLSMRPKRMSQLYGQQTVVKSIRHLMATRPPQSWLLSGGTGCGKTTLAKILALSYQCDHQQQWGEPCDDCWQRWSEFSIHETNASKETGKEEIDKIVDMSRFRPWGGNKLVIILDEAHRLSNASQNLLLVPTENPPATTIWIICTTDPAKLLPTLRRRCMSYQLKSLSFQAAEEFVKRMAKAGGVKLSVDPLIEQLHRAGVSSPGLLLMAIEQYGSGVSANDAVLSVSEGISVEGLRVCKAVTSGDWISVKKQLEGVEKENVREIRASVSGWLRGVLKNATGASDQEKAAASLLDLSQAPFDDGPMLYWLWGALWKVTRRYSR